MAVRLAAVGRRHQGKRAEWGRDDRGRTGAGETLLQVWLGNQVDRKESDGAGDKAVQVGCRALENTWDKRKPTPSSATSVPRKDKGWQAKCGAWHSHLVLQGVTPRISSRPSVSY